MPSFGGSAIKQIRSNSIEHISSWFCLNRISNSELKCSLSGGIGGTDLSSMIRTKIDRIRNCFSIANMLHGNLKRVIQCPRRWCCRGKCTYLARYRILILMSSSSRHSASLFVSVPKKGLYL